MIASMAGGTRTWETSIEKLAHAQPLGLIDRHRVRRRRGLEADAEEHHLRSGFSRASFNASSGE